MQYIVTGGGGFIGSNLVDELISDNHEVIVIDDLSSGRKENINPKAIFIEGRVDRKILSLWSPDVIFHLAAQSRIQPSFENPYYTHCANVDGTIEVLEAARKRKNIKIIFAGTSCAYQSQYDNPYALSKFVAEHYCKMYANLYGVSVGIARFFNVYGPRQMEEGSHSTVIGIFERQKRNNQNLTITGTGEKRRDFIHVKDIVSGLVFMSRQVWKGDVFDFGSGINYSIKEVAEMFHHAIEHIPERVGEADFTLADTSLAKNILGWEPKINLEDYIKSIL